MVEGVDVEPYPCNPSIPAETGPYLVKLLCRPKTEGELAIIGKLSISVVSIAQGRMRVSTRR